MRFTHLAEFSKYAKYQPFKFYLLISVIACFPVTYACSPTHERHDRTSVARRTHRNREPPIGAHEHQNHPNLRQNHRPEDKPRHGNLIVQAGGDGEEHLPSHLVTLKQHTDERRKEQNTAISPCRPT